MTGALAVDWNGQPQKDLGAQGAQSWKKILQEHKKTREDQVVDLFHEGLKVLEITEEHVPQLEEINEKLLNLTGWKGAFVDGLEDGRSFYKMLARRVFPVGNFIRDQKDLSYTPEPDIVHDLYGHLPYFVNKDYADFCQKVGELACEFLEEPELLVQFESFFWFTIEFGLIKTPNGNRVFGAGIASSTGECAYALSGEPEVLPFDVDTIRKQDFRIDQMQKRLFILESKEQLYSSLDELYQKVKSERSAG